MRFLIPVILVAAGIGTLGFAPALPAADAPARKLLFLTHAGYYKHTSLGPAEKAVTELGETGGFAVTTVEGYKQEADSLDFSFLTADYLAGFDGLMMMTNGNLPLDDSQKRAILDFVSSGKGFIGAHCASLTLYNYPEFGEMLGGYFRRTVGTEASGCLKGRRSRPPGDADAGAELAAGRRVLSVRNSGLGPGASGRERRRAV